MFGRKKTKNEDPAPEPVMAPPPVMSVPPPPPVSDFEPEPLGGGMMDLVPKPAGGVTVTPDYSGVIALAANHLIVQGGEGKIVVDVGSELRDRGDGGKVLPVTARVVMTAQTAERLMGALEMALSKLKG